MANTFLKSIGVAGRSVPTNWMVEWPDALEGTWFPKRPRSIQQGDFLIYYAAGRRLVCAVMEVTSDGPQAGHTPPAVWTKEDTRRWPWWVGVRMHFAIPADEQAPTLEQVGISPLRVRRQSHIFLSNQEYTRIVQRLLKTAGRSIQTRE